MTNGAWVAVHVAWSTLEDRRGILAALSGTVPPWWFVDLIGELEIVTRDRAPKSVAVTRGAHEPCALRPDVFPDGRVPDWYPDLLALTTARLVPVLAGGSAIADPVALATTEIDVIYRSLVAEAPWRAAALQAHSAWLERAAEHDAEKSLSTSPSGADVVTLTIPPVDEGAVAGLPDRDLTAHRAALAALAPDRQSGVAGADVAGGNDPRVQIVARLAHTQAVRILGPRPDVLELEALLTARLAARQ